MSGKRIGKNKLTVLQEEFLKILERTDGHQDRIFLFKDPQQIPIT